MPATPQVNHPRPRRRRQGANGRTVTVALGAAALLAACSSTTPTQNPATTAGGSTPAATTPGSTSGSAAAGAILKPDKAAMDAVVDKVATDLHQPGMVVLLNTPQGNYTSTHGTLAIDGGGGPVALDTKLRIGSNTKTWIGTAILQMVQEGKLKLDDPVSKYRPDVPNGANIPITQLLNMRSGLFNYTETLELNTALDNEPAKVWAPDQLLAIAFAHRPYFAPDQGYHYSNTNTVLLGVIAEALDKKPLRQIFQDRFFTPLGMTSSSFPANDDPSIPATYAHGYMYGTNVETIDNPSIPDDQLAAVRAGTLKPKDTTNDNPSWGWAAGAGISTANDLATWVKAMVGGKLLDRATQQIRMTGFQPTRPGDPKSPSYSLNLAKVGPLYGHTGELPGYNSFMGYDPVHDVTLVVWGNLAPSAEGKPPAVTLAGDLLPLVYAPATNTPDPIGTDQPK